MVRVGEVCVGGCEDSFRAVLLLGDSCVEDLNQGTHGMKYDMGSEQALNRFT